MNCLRDGIIFVIIDDNNVLGDLLIVEGSLRVGKKWFIERPRMCAWEEVGKKMKSSDFLLNNFKTGQVRKVFQDS